MKSQWLKTFLFIALLFLAGYYLVNTQVTNQENIISSDSIGMGGMYIEEKDHHVEPGDYQEMWIIGYVFHETEENQIRYKIYIEDPNVYNLIEEDKVYHLVADSFREDDTYGLVYELIFISDDDNYQMRGEGRIE